MIFNKDRLKLVTILGLAFMLLFSFSFSASAAEVNSGDNAEQMALAIYEATIYDEDTRTFEFDENKAISLGLDKMVSQKMNNYFENLSSDQAELVYESQLEKTDEVGTFVAPLIVWAAQVLGAAGLTWLADKLLDWGAAKFCKAYKNYNSVTKTVCNIIA